MVKETNQLPLEQMQDDEVVRNAQQPIGNTIQAPSVYRGEANATAPNSIVETITAMASNPDIDVAKLEKLMDLNERMLNREAAKEFAEDFVQMKPELPTVARTHNNSQTKSKYAKLEDINVVVDPVLAKYGFGTQTKIKEQTDKGVTVTAILTHRGGHKEETTIFMPLDDRGIAGTVNKTQPHAVSSSITYAKRVAICALLNISTGDDADGNTDNGCITLEQAAEIDNLIRVTGADRAKLLEYASSDDVRNIPAKNYGKTISMLKQKQKKQVTNANN